MGTRSLTVSMAVRLSRKSLRPAHGLVHYNILSLTGNGFPYGPFEPPEGDRFRPLRKT
jgi:hypothetical protein